MNDTLKNREHQARFRKNHKNGLGVRVSAIIPFPVTFKNPENFPNKLQLLKKMKNWVQLPKVVFLRKSESNITVNVKPGQTLRVTPAMEAGISDHVWSIEDILSLLGGKD